MKTLKIIFSSLFLSYSFVVFAQTDKKWTIEECVNTFSAEKASSTKVGSQYWFADKDFADGQTVKLSVVGPYKQTHAPHRHAEDEFTIILEGKAIFFLDGDSITVSPLTCLYAPSNVEHCLRNAGDTELKYLVVKNFKK
jgi:mannose-6-phosphate isomerase-like protein (cupin superfamily)